MQYKYIIPRDDKNTRALAKGTITIVFSPKRFVVACRIVTRNGSMYIIPPNQIRSYRSHPIV